MAAKKFLRTDYMRWARLGKNRKKIQAWRGAKGKHSKIRRQRKGYPVMPMVGFASPRKEVGKISGLQPILVHNVQELSALNKSMQIAIVARVGAKKKLDIMKKAQDLNIKVVNAGGKK